MKPIFAGRILKGLIVVLATLFVLLVGSGLYLLSIYEDLPDVGVIEERLPADQTSTVFAADGTLLASWHGEQDRTPVTLDEMADVLPAAVVAAEDERFWEHSGVDIGAILRSFVFDPSEDYSAGGSTVSQQTVKLLLFEEGSGIGRRVREALLAYQLEADTAKETVLEAYMNLAYFGHGKYGVEAASRYYFGKHVSDVTLAEAALLAGVINSPGRFSPQLDPEASRARRDLVLSRMEDQGLVTPSAASEARQEAIELAPPEEVPEFAPHFVEYVKQGLIDSLGADEVYGGGLEVHTTLDPSIQRAAEAAIATHLPAPDDPEVALVCLDHSTGAIRAMVGGRDFQANQFNLAAQGRRQPGSAFKPFVFLAALEAGVPSSARYSTAPFVAEVDDGVWRVENYEGSFPDSTLSISEATVLSVNAVFARLVMDIGPEAVVDVAGRMGISSELDANPAIALGGLTEGVSPLEMASAFGTVASGGLRRPPVFASRVLDDSADTLIEATDRPTRAITEEVAVQTSLVLHDVVERGTGTAADPGFWSAGKTGTTQSYRDAWFVGYSGNLVTAVWVGFPEGQVDMLDVHGTRVSGGTFPARIWRDFNRSVQGASQGGEAQGDIAATGSIVSVCPDTFLLANPRCPDAVQLSMTPEQTPAGICALH